MKVTLLTYGSRGDVQPLLLVADNLRARGHSVCIATNTSSLDFVRQLGFDPVEIPVDIRSFLESEGPQQTLLSGNALRFSRELADIEEQFGSAVDSALIAACAGADVVASGPLTLLRAMWITEASGQPLTGCLPYPVDRTSEYPSPYLMARPTSFGPFAFATHAAFEQAYRLTNFNSIRRTRKTLGLSKAVPNGYSLMRRRAVPADSLVSPVLFPRPADWRPEAQVVGTPRVSQAHRDAWGEGHFDPELDSWLSADLPPLFFSFGSLPVDTSKTLLDLIVRAARRVKRRALIVSGWSDFPPGFIADGAGIVRTQVDYYRVLPRCVVAVHAGGPGTTHDVARAGIPSVVVHVAGDQVLWGWRVEAAGVGVRLPFTQLTEDKLVDALTQVLNSVTVKRAQEVAECVSAEDGTSIAAETIEKAAT